MKKNMMKVMLLSMLFAMAIPFTVMAEEVATTTQQVAQTEPAEKISTSLAAPKFSTVTRKGGGKTTLKWGKVSKATGYQIQYSTSSTYKNAKTINVAKGTSTSKAIAKLSTKKDTYIRIRSVRKSGTTTVYSKWNAGVKVVVWKSGWTYAKNSKIHSDPVILYYSHVTKKKNITVAVNAGHGCSGGSSKKTLSHPDGSAKVTGGTNAAGAKYSMAISSGTSVKGMSEAAANLKIAMKLKTKLLNAGYNVLMIRQDSNTKLDNIARTVMANQNANCHIAIHFDSTSSNKGAFYIGVPNIGSYRSMMPVRANWRKHNALGASLVSGLRSAGVKIWGSGNLPMDLTQTSYSRIASVDIEVGDQGTSTSDSNLSKIANGLLKGISKYY
ncbi:MAG: N-acetylmuramoyl-L-alanine amidase [Eubacteriales bacterium]|nr:N-acetylmuramoyl-L-alanine amidase [Eubacteriales bacterium]